MRRINPCRPWAALAALVVGLAGAPHADAKPPAAKAARVARDPQPRVVPARPTEPIGVPRPEATRIGCSLTEPVCVHALGTVAPAVAARALGAAERTLVGLRALALPGPLGDGALGGGPELDLYLEPGASGARAYPDDPVPAGADDRASGFARIGLAAGPSCALESNVARAVAAAMLLRFDPAAHESIVAIGSSQLAAALAPCAALEADAIDRFQRHPELGLGRARADRLDGALWFANYLDETYGKAPLRLWTVLVALGGHRTPPGAATWKSEPDVYDLLRRLLGATGSSLEDALVGFAIARAFAGSRSDEAHLADAARFGAFGRVRFDWSVPLRPVEPGGAAFVWLGLGGATERDRLTVVAECEETHAFRWALVTVDAEGRETGRHLAGRWGEGQVQLSLAKLDDAAGVLVIGAAAGPDDRAQPFHAADAPHAAGCEVTLHKQ
jgi:hypothetical protein